MTVPASSEVPPKISVVVPAYNHALELGEAIDSLLAQDTQDFELIVVDDGSTDATEARLRSYGDRLRYVRQANGGPGKARNTGIEAARGQYVAFCDADDRQLPHRLRVQSAVLDARPEVALVFSDFQEWAKGRITVPSVLHTRWLGPSSRSFRDDLERHFSASIPLASLTHPLPPGFSGRRVYLGRVPGLLAAKHVAWAGATMARRAVLSSVGGFSERLRAYEDWMLSSEIAKHHDLAYVDLPTFLYRIHERQATRLGRRQAECYRDAVQAVWRSDPVFYARYREAIDLSAATAFAMLGEVEARAGNYAEAEANFRRALATSRRVGKRPIANLLLTALRHRFPGATSGLMGQLLPPVLPRGGGRRSPSSEGSAG